MKFIVHLLVVLILASGFFYAWRTMKSASEEKSSQRTAPEVKLNDATEGKAPLAEFADSENEKAIFKPGQPVFIRIFKEERELELWMKREKGFRLYKTYPIAAMSGVLGPKLAEGDRQAPEGFYSVEPEQMNPNSRFHLSFNIGYPNEYDRSLGRTGTYIMVHGSNVSIGCFAMTDEKIDEIYVLCDAAFKQGQASFGVHVFPFRMSAARLAEAKGSKHFAFWQNLKEGYDLFEHDRIPPKVSVTKGRYRFGVGL